MRFAFVLFLAGHVFAQSADQLEFFEKKVRPILATNCYACHGQKMQMSGLNFSSAEGLAKVVSPGDSAESRLYKAVSYADKIKMPPAGKLADQDIADLKAWIEIGRAFSQGRLGCDAFHQSHVRPSCRRQEILGLSAGTRL